MSNDESPDQAASWAKRLRARELGQVPLGRELTSALALVGGLGLIGYVAKDIWQSLEQVAVQYWRCQAAAVSLAEVFSTLGQFARPLMLLLGGAFLIAFGVGWLQTGCGLFWMRLSPDWGRVNPMQNFHQIHAGNRWLNSLLGMARWLLLWGVVAVCIWMSRDSLIAIQAGGNSNWLATAGSTVFAILLKVLAAIGLLGAADYGLQWWRHERRLRMSPEEVRQELRAAQIDPYVAQRRKSLGHGFVQSSIIRSVRKSNLIVTDSTGATIGLAIQGNGDDAVSVVVRAGETQAEGIRQLADRLEIPLCDHSVASRLFARCRTGQTVPPDLCLTVRELVSNHSAV
jgi:flagellar biosynthetic protein FlhB